MLRLQYWIGSTECNGDSYVKLAWMSALHFETTDWLHYQRGETWPCLEPFTE